MFEKKGATLDKKGASVNKKRCEIGQKNLTEKGCKIGQKNLRVWKPANTPLLDLSIILLNNFASYDKDFKKYMLLFLLIMLARSVTDSDVKLH